MEVIRPAKMPKISALRQVSAAPHTRRETVEHPFDTLKMRMWATHFLMKTLPKVATDTKSQQL
jgi:hypothetical protein